jgi:hypothetical protein
MVKKTSRKRNRTSQAATPKDTERPAPREEEVASGVYTHVIVLKNELADSAGKFYHWNINCPELSEKGEDEFLILLEAEARRQGFAECPRCHCSEFESVEIILNPEE